MKCCSLQCNKLDSPESINIFFGERRNSSNATLNLQVVSVFYTIMTSLITHVFHGNIDYRNLSLA